MDLREKIVSWINKRKMMSFRDRRKRPRKNKTLISTHTAPNTQRETLPGGIVYVKNRPDSLFLILYVLLLILGTVLSFSAGSAYAEEQYGSGFYFLTSHLKHLAVGLFATCIVYIFSKPRHLKMFSLVFYGGSILLLVAVLFFGTTGGGAKRWLNFGAFTLQPSELAKTAIILLLALYLTHHEEHAASKKLTKKSFLHGLFVPSVIFGLVCLLVVLENHLSGLIIIAFIGVFMIYLGGVSLKWILGIYPPIGAAAIGVYLIMKPYALKRLVTWLSDSSDNLSDNWQSTQGLYAIGSGGLFGLGFGESKLKYGYVSQPQNDFVFTIVCEELGFFGATAILLLFAVLVIRGIQLGMRAPDKFTSMVILGITFKLAIHVILNVGVVTGVLPNTGISLPFFSSGGSATITQMIDMGILLGLSRYCTQQR